MYTKFHPINGLRDTQGGLLLNGYDEGVWHEWKGSEVYFDN